MRWLFLFLFFLSLAPPAQAATIRYYEDPPYQPINKEDPHPMADLVALAEQGDGRAQFILGDLYGKGKGGLGKNQVKARYWLETAARNGYTMSFIRLAAMAKRARDYTAAYKWYSLSVDNGTSKERRWSSKARELLSKDGRISKDDQREAREAINDWLKKREKVLAEDHEKARLAREKAEQVEETVKITGKVPVQKNAGYKFIKKENEYNE